LIDKSTTRVIALHRDDVKSQHSQNDTYYYPNGATNILPVVDFIKGTNNFAYIVCTSIVQVERMANPGGRSLTATLLHPGVNPQASLVLPAAAMPTVAAERYALSIAIHIK
jgi:hypothetical protein